MDYEVEFVHLQIHLMNIIVHNLNVTVPSLA